MTSKVQIRDEKLQYDINREAAKISALSSGKIDKHEYLTFDCMFLSMSCMCFRVNPHSIVA